MRSGLARTVGVFYIYPVLQALFDKGLELFHFAGIFLTWSLLLREQAQSHQDLVRFYGRNMSVMQFQQVGD